jgi:hypothetical protein
MTREEAISLREHTNDDVKFYGLITGPDYGDGFRKLVPEHMRKGMVNWICFGIVPGDFLSALIEGDFYRLAWHADDINSKNFMNYARFFYNYAPSTCSKQGALKRWKGLFPVGVSEQQLHGTEGQTYNDEGEPQ